MQVFISTSNLNTFKYNGLTYPKNFMCIKQDDSNIAIHNAYDTRFQLLGSTHFSQIQVDGVVHSSQANLMAALSTLLFTKQFNYITQSNQSTKLISVGEITVDGNYVTVEPAEWLINGINYETTSNTVLTVPFAATGKNRIDIIIGDTLNQIIRIAGDETTGIAVAPVVPLDTVYITQIAVNDNAIDEPEEPVISDLYITKAQEGVKSHFEDGVVDNLILDKYTHNLLSASITEVRGVNFGDGDNQLYIGKVYSLINRQSTDIVLKHDSPYGVYRFYLNHNQDYILKPTETIEFWFTNFGQLQQISQLPTLQNITDNGNNTTNSIEVLDAIIRVKDENDEIKVQISKDAITVEDPYLNTYGELSSDYLRFFENSTINILKNPSQSSDIDVYWPVSGGSLSTEQFVNTGLATKVSTGTTININGVVQDLSANRQWRAGLSNTGALTYGGISIASASGKTVNIGACTGIISDNETNPSSPNYTLVTYSGETNKLVPTVSGGTGTYVMLTSGGTISFQNTFPTSAQRKQNIYLSKISHPDSANLAFALNEVDFVTSPLAQFRDIFQAIQYMNQGISASGNAGLTINTTNGNILGDGINFVSDKTNPNTIAVAAGAPRNFLLLNQSGAVGSFVTTIDPTTYDVGGVTTTVGGSTNRSTIQYLYYAPGVGFAIQRGQTVYSNLTDAVAAVGRESFTIRPNLVNNSILIAAICLRHTTTAMNDSNFVRILSADKFGQLGGASAGISVTNLQTAYNNGVQPQITTDSTRGAVAIQRGSATDTDNIFEGRNGSGVVTSYIKGDGTSSFGGKKYFSITYWSADNYNQSQSVLNILDRHNYAAYNVGWSSNLNYGDASGTQIFTDGSFITIPFACKLVSATTHIYSSSATGNSHDIEVRIASGQIVNPAAAAINTQNLVLQRINQGVTIPTSIYKTVNNHTILSHATIPAGGAIYFSCAPKTATGSYYIGCSMLFESI